MHCPLPPTLQNALYSKSWSSSLIAVVFKAKKRRLVHATPCIHPRVSNRNATHVHNPYALHLPRQLYLSRFSVRALMTLEKKLVACDREN